MNEVTDVPEGFSKWVERNEERIAEARKKGTLPYFLRENEGYVGKMTEGKEEKTAPVSAEPKQERSTDIHDLMETMSPELRARMELLHERSREYRRLLDDPDYRDVEFNPTNGGLRATHINHKTHPNDNKRYFPELLTGDDLEDEFQRIAFEKGHSVIFREEAENTTDLDMFLDGVKMDLISVTSNSPIFKNQLKRKNGQLKDYNALYGENNESVCMYFHDPSFYTEDKVRQGINRLKEMGTDVKIKKVYVMLNDDSDMIEIILE